MKGKRVTTPTQTSPAYDLETLRQQFAPAREGLAYLNHAGMSPLPLVTQQAMQAAISAMADKGSGVYEETFAVMDALREKAAALVHTKVEEIAMVPNTSTAINFIAQTLPLEAGDEVLLCDVEFPSNVYPWQNLAGRGVKTRLVSARKGGLDIALLEEELRPETRVVAVSGVQYFTGRREDLEAIGALCAAHGAFLVVDAIQAAGIVPLDMDAMNITALAAGGQKALMGPPGLGFMALRASLLEQTRPPFLGATSVVDYLDWLLYDTTPQPDATRYHMGTPNIAGVYGLDASLGMLLELGVAHISTWVEHLSRVAIADLTDRGFEVITPRQAGRFANIVTFAYPKDAFEGVRALQQRGIILREHMNAQHEFYLRIATHAYNTEDDVLRVGEALEETL
jgi:selenocysteine lyase/cysteine desulfurase